MSSGERPTGAANGKQSDTEALCQPPPPPCATSKDPGYSLGTTATVTGEQKEV